MDTLSLTKEARMYNGEETNLFNKWCREGNSNPLQYSCLENPLDGGAW